MIRLAIGVRGVVQGVGFRPFVYRIAHEHGVAGWVRNSTDGVHIEVEGDRSRVDGFVEALRGRVPPAAHVEGLDFAEMQVCAEQTFRIVASAGDIALLPSMPPDLAVCVDCAQEIATPHARRHRYPFTNCTRCGPRYTIIESLPYDRARTSMAAFAMCTDCSSEYTEPSDRRFHAQPIACPACGPQLTLLDADGHEAAHGDHALQQAAALVRSGFVLAVQGLGGVHLLVDATNATAVARLRARKNREAKAFAVMFPSLASVREQCAVSELEERALCSPEAPIVLLHKRADSATPLVDGIAPGNPRLGAMLPYTPLHRLFLDATARPLVCTSGNISDEPICTETAIALAKLRGIADWFLVHDRPIVRPVDDSVAQVGPLGLTILRRARGYSPLPLPLIELSTTVLALGAQRKATVAVAFRGQVVVSQHVGDVQSAAGAELLERTARDLLRFYDLRPAVIACDLHPDYASTRLAEQLASEWKLPIVRVQHHHAHVAACMAEHGLTGRVLGFAWDGNGYGSRGEVWGGEALECEGAVVRRVAHLRPFRLPGGDRALREPRRAALGLLHEIFGRDATKAAPWLADAQCERLFTMIERSVNTPVTTSMGRLFDAVAALIGLCDRNEFEGQAAMALEFAAEDADDDEAGYPFPLRGRSTAEGDWEPLVRALLQDRRDAVPASLISARFHSALADLARRIAVGSDPPRVVLSGGCFQNQRLLRQVRSRLEAAGRPTYAPQRFPPNDGAIALGQVLVASRTWKESSDVSRHSG